MSEKIKNKPFVATRNACKVCTPLGASIAFKGVHGCVPLIHGSQGCATYIRRYLISHYKEPVDIASTNFTEESAIFGGEQNLNVALNNVTKQYSPKIIAIATTCLSETIGDDMHKIIGNYKKDNSDSHILPEIIHASTPSFKGTHMDGYHEAVLSLVKSFARFTETKQHVNVFPGFFSTEDIRHLKEIMTDFSLKYTVVPDYSDILDYRHTNEYERIPEGGTTLEELKDTGSAKASIDFGYIQNKAYSKSQTAAEFLEKDFSVIRFNTGMPIGIKETDHFFNLLKEISGKETPQKYNHQRGRLVDAYIDGHKYVFGKKAIVYGEEDFVVAMVSFLEEIGIQTVLCASGGESGYLNKIIEEKIKPAKPIPVHDGYDFEDIANAAAELRPDVLIGNSKGYYITRKLGIPLLRVGFPIHDRMGGQRIKHIGYEGTQELFDKLVNLLIEYKQDHSPVGYKYM
ncbi:MAG: nitrogenase [Bacteroidales bacterium]|nr:nitrogenase [Bacteroidales bacterium]